jgi:hypothetical protein
VSKREDRANLVSGLQCETADVGTHVIQAVRELLATFPMHSGALVGQKATVDSHPTSLTQRTDRQPHADVCVSELGDAGRNCSVGQPGYRLSENEVLQELGANYR